VSSSRANRRTTSLDCNSRSGSPLLTRDAWRFRQQNDKDNKRSHCLNLSRDTIRQKEDSYTPASTCSYNRNGDRNPSVIGSWDGTTFSGDDEMDGLDLPRQGCGIPCYWSRTPKHRGSGGCSFSPSFSDSVRRKVSNMVSRNQTTLQKESPLSSYNYKRSIRLLNCNRELLSFHIFLHRPIDLFLIRPLIDNELGSVLNLNIVPNKCITSNKTCLQYCQVQFPYILEQ
jgi:hypothetical protein